MIVVIRAEIRHGGGRDGGLLIMGILIIIWRTPTSPVLAAPISVSSMNNNSTNNNIEVETLLKIKTPPLQDGGVDYLTIPNPLGLNQ